MMETSHGRIRILVGGFVDWESDICRKISPGCKMFETVFLANSGNTSTRRTISLNDPQGVGIVHT